MSKARLISWVWFALLLMACVLPGPGGTFGPPPESPLIPNQVPVILDNQWRLTEILYNGMQREFDSIKPVLITFEPGLLGIQACNNLGIYLDTTEIEDPNEYRFLGGAGTAVGCPGGRTEQEEAFLEALTVTNHYEIEGDTLILSGENARLTFVIDNEAKKPSD